MVNIPFFCFGFNHPFWWCRISQPSTVWLGNVENKHLNIFEPYNRKNVCSGKHLFYLQHFNTVNADNFQGHEKKCMIVCISRHGPAPSKIMGRWYMLSLRHLSLSSHLDHAPKPCIPIPVSGSIWQHSPRVIYGHLSHLGTTPVLLKRLGHFVKGLLFVGDVQVTSWAVESWNPYDLSWTWFTAPW